MEVHIADDQVGRYFRQKPHGLRLIGHGARANPACQWSGLTPDQLVTLRRRWMFNSEERLRGPSPSSFQVFFRSARSTDQSALFLCIARAVGIASTASLEDGEKLCEAFEIFREWEPRSELEFEQAALLLAGSLQAEKIALGYCSNCSTTMLIDRLASTRRTCKRCHRAHAARDHASSRPNGNTGPSLRGTLEKPLTPG